MDWTALGNGYPDPNPSGPLGDAQRATFDVLAPLLAQYGVRSPVYELGHEQTPTPEAVWELAGTIAREVLRTTRTRGDYPQDRSV